MPSIQSRKSANRIHIIRLLLEQNPGLSRYGLHYRRKTMETVELSSRVSPFQHIFGHISVMLLFRKRIDLYNIPCIIVLLAECQRWI